MSESVIFQVIGSLATVIGTGISLSNIFAKKLDGLEKTLTTAIDETNKKIAKLDKNIAIHGVLIEQILKQKGCIYGRDNRNSKINDDIED